MASPSPDWQALAANKRASNYNKIPPGWRLPTEITARFNSSSTESVLDIPLTCGILTPRELDITSNYDATALVQLMAKGELTSREVTVAFCKRAAVAQQCVNCLTEICFEEAIGRAEELDRILGEEGRVVGELHGLPVSLKDSFNLLNTQATIGYTSFLSHPPSPTSSVLVSILQSAGAIFHCKTNLPQSMMTADSHNNIFGRTLNPHNLSLTAGGSTGGEGALIAMRGSVLGMCTDIAGSIRIPALCNGVVGFKPTASRVPFAGGVPPGRLGSPAPILPVAGPQATSVRDCELVMRVVMDAQPWDLDEGVLNVPWRRVQPKPVTTAKPEAELLRFGLLRGHAKRPLHPPVARALHSAATKLKEAGHTIVLLDDQIPDLYESTILAWKFFMLDPQKTPAKIVQAGGEPWVPSIATATLPELKDFQPSLDGLFDLNVERAKICRKWREVLVDNKLDAVLMPGYQATAVKHDTYGIPIYTVLANLLNYPAGILPYLKADKKLDEQFFKADVAYEPPYEPEAFEGAPAAIQIMGKPMLDEELIEMLKSVEKILETGGQGVGLP